MGPEETATAELNALAALTFNWTRSLEDVWLPSPYHVEGLHAETTAMIRRGIEEARVIPASSPIGIAIQGQRGVGKTHLLGWTRQQVQQLGGYFFLVKIESQENFWDEVVDAFVDRLQPHSDGSLNQLEALLADLTRRAGVDGTVRDAVLGRTTPSPADLNLFINALRRLDRKVGMTCQDTARALTLLASPEPEHQDIGYFFLTNGDIDLEVRRHWGIRSKPKRRSFMISELSNLLALSGPTVVAVDQIDALIDEIGKDPDDDDATERQVSQVASGLMNLRDATHRTLTILSCLPESWSYIERNAVDTVTDRFRQTVPLQNLPSANIAATMIAKRFALEFGTVGFTPPYPTWPIRPGAFEGAPNYTARQLLRRIEGHINRCLRQRTVIELESLDESSAAQAVAAGAVQPSQTVIDLAGQADLAQLDAEFGKLRAEADVAAAFDPRTEDEVMPGLLAAGLEAWIRERDDAQEFTLESLPGRKPALHAWLMLIVDDRTERQRKWAFRAISADSAKAVLNRLRTAVSRSGLDEGYPAKQLFVLRNTRWPSGPTSDRETDDFSAKGGVALAVTADDLQVFAALEQLLKDRHPSLNAWLMARQPAHGAALLERALRTAPAAAQLSATPPRESPVPARSEAGGEPGVFVGTAVRGQTPARLDLASLRRHAAVFAGSGSGKTVLLRRIIEECALQGVSSIVLDPNNDLARLGDAWPEPPDSWSADDAARAGEYLEHTDVVAWTPRRQGGRPLTFQPLPAFADVLDDEDEFQAAVDSAVDALAPRIKADRPTAKSIHEKAVLTEALRYFGQQGESDLDAFIDLLTALPAGVSRLNRSAVTAADLADRLGAVRVTDPLFGGAAQAADPGLLLTPTLGKRARVSVISMVGLTSDEQKLGFVNQLQMALFSWIKKHPAHDRPLGGLLVMDEAQTLAPSGRSTISTQSTLLLASQARKYGLGLLFATQSPRGLHNQVAGNATTQFFGLLNAPTQIDAARELAKAKGGDVSDISRLPAGQFYLATEGQAFRQIRTSMCLTYHPSSPLTEEEVIARARR
ncbi:MAG TPA: DUF87 domain-containing protein [Streptosporangiaceae bacterium]|jgi:hypothetical protein